MVYVNEGSILAIGIIFPILCIFAVGLRFHVRIRHRVGLKADDWLCIPALIILIATGSVLITGSVKHVFGYYPPSQSASQALSSTSGRQTLLAKLEISNNIINPVGTGCVRLSFLFLYKRLFRGRAFDITFWTTVVAVSAWAVANSVTQLAGCGTHFSAPWESVNDVHKYCVNTRLWLLLFTLTGFVLDCVIFAMPFFWIWNLRMKTSQKWAVSSVFMCGLFTLCAGALRLAAAADFLKFQYGKVSEIVGIKILNDVYGLNSIYQFWQYIEYGTGLVICCLPALGPLFRDRFAAFSIFRFRSITSWLSKRRSEHELSSKESTKSSVGGSSSNEIQVTMTVEQTKVDGASHPAYSNNPFANGGVNLEKPKASLPRNALP